MSAKRSLFNELKRRNVFRASAAYIALGWVVTQVTATVVPILHLPESVTPIVLWIGVIGFPFLVMFAWIYEITPEGLKRESEVVRDQSITRVTGRRLDYAVIALMVVGIGLFAYDRVRPRALEPPAPATAAAAPAAPADTAPPAVSDASIAVLPFNNMSSDKEQEYFSDGISEELLNLLAKIPSLQVAARTSSFSFKGQNVEIPEIARQLRVAHVLEGSVRKSGNQIRITAQLIRADSGYHLWSETYDREFTDIFKLQDEIAGEVVSALKLKLLPGQAPAATSPTANTEAYNQYLLGNQYYSRGNVDGLRGARTAYRRAVELDPKFAQAHAALALAEGYAGDREESAAAYEEGLRRAREAAERAIVLAPDLADGYLARGWFRLGNDNDWSGGLADLEKALALNPGNADVQRVNGRVQSWAGRQSRGIAASRRATELDPLSARAWENLGTCYLLDGRYPEAEQALDRSLAISPEGSVTSYWLGITYLLQGRAQDALPLFAKAGDGFGHAGKAMAEHALGHADAARAVLDELAARFGHAFAYQIATVHAHRGDRDEAFAWLQRAHDQHDGGVSIMKVDPLLASLRGDPRYAALLKKWGFPE